MNKQEARARAQALADYYEIPYAVADEARPGELLRGYYAEPAATVPPDQVVETVQFVSGQCKTCPHCGDVLPGAECDKPECRQAEADRKMNGKKAVLAQKNVGKYTVRVWRWREWWMRPEPMPELCGSPDELVYEILDEHGRHVGGERAPKNVRDAGYRLVRQCLAQLAHGLEYLCQGTLL